VSGFWGRSGNLVLDQSTTGFDPERSLAGLKSRSAAADGLGGGFLSRPISSLMAARIDGEFSTIAPVGRIRPPLVARHTVAAGKRERLALMVRDAFGGRE